MDRPKDLCFTVDLQTFCLFISLLLFVCKFTLCSIISVHYHHHLQLWSLATRPSHLAMQYCSASLEMMCGSTRNLIDFGGLKVAHFCQTGIYDNIDHNDNNNIRHLI